jgi:hypothetical protein
VHFFFLFVFSLFAGGGDVREGRGASRRGLGAGGCGARQVCERDGSRGVATKRGDYEGHALGRGRTEAKIDAVP